MGWIIGCITILGLLTGIYMLFKTHKIYGMLQLVLAILCPTLTIMFCSLKKVRAFGGTDLDFLIRSATEDGDIWPWIILVLFIIEFIFIIKTIFTLLKRSQG